MDLWTLIPPAWQSPLTPVRPKIEGIAQQMARDPKAEIVPQNENIFRALQLSPNEVRVVIVGQDPYPNPTYACGLSFSVPRGTTPLPGSLRNILTEVVSDTGSTQIVDGDLSPWVEQGVMLLNRTLTAAAFESGSHQNWGWNEVTDRIIDVVVQSNPNVVGILWGKKAQELNNKFDDKHVISGVHPSPLSAQRGFFGSAPFSQVNRILQHDGYTPIRW